MSGAVGCGTDSTSEMTGLSGERTRSRIGFPSIVAGLSRPRVAMIVSVTWLVVAALLYLLPALLRGTNLGTQDLLGVDGLGTIPGTHPHNFVASDQVTEMMPWSALSWVDVRHGQLPLWNPYSGLGLPLFLNFVSGLTFPADVGQLLDT